MIRFLKSLFRILIQKLYRIEVTGLEHINESKSTIFIANHTSLLDGIIIELFVPMPKAFFIDTIVAEKPMVRFLLKFIDFFPINVNNPFSLKRMLKSLKFGGNCVIFPEGRVSVTGGLMKIQHGTGIIAERGGYDILPIWISGAVRSPMSYSRKKHVPKLFPKITVNIQKPFKISVDPAIRGKKRRELLSLQISNALQHACFNARNTEMDLFETLATTAKEYGYSRAILQDLTFVELTYKKLLLGSLILGKKIRQAIPNDTYVGFMLPNSNGAVVTFFGMQAYGLTPAIINFSSGIESIRAAVTVTELKTIVTSRLAVERGKLEPIINGLSDLVGFIYLEDLKDTLSFSDKIAGLLALKNPIRAREAYRKKPDDAAAVIFTSGSEGLPKGVVLSNRNILTNIAQVSAQLNLTPDDINFNVLPIFHSFGLTVGTIFPLLRGIKVFMYPSPLHYGIIPQVVYETNATVLIATDTFYAGYARRASPYDFQSLRLAVSGAEKIKKTTQDIFFEKFGIRFLAGYGATEASPVISCNTPVYNRVGTVGRILPGIEYRLEKIPGFDDGGQLFIKGPNIMKGYLKYDKPGVIESVGDWYDTGDIVEIDDMRFIKIVGRVKRFVKIAGEMVSLGAVENMLSEIDPQCIHAAIPVNSERKGQEIHLVTELKTLDRKQISEFASKTGKSPLLVPIKVIFMQKIPLLATGKINYPDVSKHINLP